jgi:large subunit ribosomal protein L18
MSIYKTKQQKRLRRHLRIRQKIAGTAACPRFCVSVTANNIYCQFIDDEQGLTLAAASTLDKSFKEQNARANLEGAALLGKIAAEKAKAAKISEVVFDRSGFAYHGRIKALAEAARENGLKF